MPRLHEMQLSLLVSAYLKASHVPLVVASFSAGLMLNTGDHPPLGKTAITASAPLILLLSLHLVKEEDLLTKR